MGLLAAAVVIAGFSQTVDASLFHPSIPRPTILWFHGAAFSAWVLFYIFQSTLVRTKNVKLHRSLGWFGAGLGSVMVPLGITTAVVMGRFDIHVLHSPGVEDFLIIPFYDMVVFGTLLSLAILWRKKPDFHRRLLFIATVGLLDAAFGRFQYLFDSNLYAVCMDSVMLLGVARDVLVDRRIHKVYLMRFRACSLHRYFDHLHMAERGAVVDGNCTFDFGIGVCVTDIRPCTAMVQGRIRYWAVKNHLKRPFKLDRLWLL